MFISVISTLHMDNQLAKHCTYATGIFPNSFDKLHYCGPKPIVPVTIAGGWSWLFTVLLQRFYRGLHNVCNRKVKSAIWMISLFSDHYLTTINHHSSASQLQTFCNPLYSALQVGYPCAKLNSDTLNCMSVVIQRVVNLTHAR